MEICEPDMENDARYLLSLSVKMEFKPVIVPSEVHIQFLRIQSQNDLTRNICSKSLRHVLELRHVLNQTALTSDKFASSPMNALCK